MKSRICVQKAIPFFPKETYYHISSSQDGQEAHLKKMKSVVCVLAYKR